MDKTKGVGVIRKSTKGHVTKGGYKIVMKMSIFDHWRGVEIVENFVHVAV